MTFFLPKEKKKEEGQRLERYLGGHPSDDGGCPGRRGPPRQHTARGLSNGHLFPTVLEAGGPRRRGSRSSFWWRLSSWLMGGPCLTASPLRLWTARGLSGVSNSLVGTVLSG